MSISGQRFCLRLVSNSAFWIVSVCSINQRNHPRMERDVRSLCAYAANCYSVYQLLCNAKAQPR